MNRKNTLAAIWLIGLGILFLIGDIWPGILILIGISLIVSAYFKEEQPAETPPAAKASSEQVNDVAEKSVEPSTGEPLPDVLAPEAERLYLTSQLPEKCPACDAPLKANVENLEWHEDKSFACPFCGYRVQL